MLPLLELIKKGKTWHLNEIIKTLAIQFKLTKEEANQLKSSSRTETVFGNRVQWAKFHLKKALLLESPKKGYVKITSRGIKLLTIVQPKEITTSFLRRYEEFDEFMKNQKKS